MIDSYAVQAGVLVVAPCMLPGKMRLNFDWSATLFF